MKPLLAANHLHLTLSGRQVFNIEHLALYEGEVLALVGPNGAGKSSLILTLAFLQNPTGGTIQFDGVTANGSNIVSLRRRMAVVFQEALLLDATVQRNLMIPLRIRGVPKSEAAARAEKWLHRFGISHLAHQSARRLSGGEAQRTSLARAFALEPEVLFLDEPFGSLDYPTRKSLLSELRQILTDMRTTTLFVTHDYSEIPYLSERVAVLHEGRIIKNGTLQEVFGAEALAMKAAAPWEI